MVTHMLCGPPLGPRLGRAGLTLVELLATLTILGLLVGFGLPKLHDVREKALVARAIGDLRAIQLELMAYEVQGQALPTSLTAIGRGTLVDPWGHPYVYNRFNPAAHGVPAGARRDRFLVPVNSTFDLYSMGPDGQSVPPFSGPGADDIVRANDGGFVGPAHLY